MDSYFYFFIRLLSAFSFLCQDANKTKSSCAIIGCNLSKKHKLTQYKTQNGESNYVDHKFFFNFYQELPPVPNLGDRHPNRCLVRWCMYCVTLRLHDIKKLTSVSLEYTIFTFLVKVLPPHFHYKLGSYLCLFLLYILLSQN